MDLVFFSFFYALSAISVCRFFLRVDVRALHVMFFVLLFSGGTCFNVCGHSSFLNIGFGVFLNTLFGGIYMMGSIYGGTFLELSRKSAGWIFVGILSFFIILFFWNGDEIITSAPFIVLGRMAYYFLFALIICLFLLNVMSIDNINEN